MTMNCGQLVRYSIAALVALAACDAGPFDERDYPDPTAFPRPPQTVGCKVDGLAKEHVTIPLGVGLRSNVDDKILPLGALAELQNQRFGRLGEVVKRTGTAELSSGLLGTTDTLPPAWALGTLGGCLVELAGAGVDHPVNMYSPTAGQWATDATNGPIATGWRGPVVTTPTRVSGVGHYADMAYASGFYFVASRGGPSGVETVIETIVDATTGKKVAERTYTDVTSVFNLGVRVVNGYAVFVRDTTANDLKFDAWLISNLDAGPTTTTFATTTSSTRTQTFDILVKDATTISVAFVSGGNAAAVDFVPSTGATTAWTPQTDAGATIPISDALGWMLDLGGAGKIALITHGAAAGVRVQWDLPTAGAARSANATYVGDAAAATVANVAGYTRGSAAFGEFTVLYDSTSGPLKAATRTAGIITGGLVYYRGVAMRSKPWQQGSGYFIVAEFNSTAQTTRYVLQLPAAGASIAAPLAIAQPRSGLPTGPLSAAVSPSSGTWVSALTVQIRLPSNPAGYAATDAGIEMLSVSFKSIPDTTTGAPREATGSVFVPGGALGQFDGSTYAEAGFAYYPETPAAPALAGGGSLTPSSTYYWKFVYAYVDANGRTWRSAPSLVLSQLLGAGDSKATIAIPTLRLTGRSNVFIEVYRGGANGSVTFQKVGSVVNSITADTVSFVDTVSDATQATGEFLYTNGGGVLPNDSIPGFTAIAVAGNRLWGVDGSVLWFSDVFVDGQGLRFSEQKRVIVRDTHGDFYAVAAQPNGNVVAFKADATYIISGDGPDAAGRGAFGVQMISPDIGTSNPRSVVETSAGVEFLSTSTKTGFHRVTTGLDVTYIGGPVQKYVTDTVVGAVMIPTMQEVRWYTRRASVGRILVHDLVTDGWSVDSPLGLPTAATAYNGGAAYYGSDTLTVIVDATASYTDGASANQYPVTTETPWIKLADLKGYQRIYRVQGVGETVAAHTLSITAYKDFDTSTPIWSGTVTPGTLWDWEWRYSAKFQALKLVITYTSANAGAKMTGLVMQYGVKPGMRPGASSKRAA